MLWLAAGCAAAAAKPAFAFAGNGSKKAAAPAFAFNATAPAFTLNGSKKAAAPTGAKEATPAAGASVNPAFAFGAARPRFTGEFPWQRVPTMCQTGVSGRFVRSGNMTGTGRYDNKVVRFLAENYDLIVAGDTQPGVEGCLESKVKDFADRVASFNPHARVLVYNANQIHHGADRPPGCLAESNYLCGLDRFKPEWRATTDNGTDLTTGGGKYYVHNLSNPGCRKWWVGVVTNASLGDNVAGVFADNVLDQPPRLPGVSAQRGAAMLQGQQQLLKELVQAGKYTIYNGIRYATTNKGVVRNDYDSLTNDLPYASAGYFEPWLSASYRNTSTGKLNAERAVHAMLTMINVSRTQPSKGITFKAGPGPCVGYVAGLLGCTWPFANGSKPTPNGWNGTPQTAQGMRAAAAKLITFPLATFLCAANSKWHLDFTWGYEVNYFVPGDPATHALPGQPKLQSLAPDGWWPELLLPPGTPLGECTYDATDGTFSREWSGVSVSFNVRDETAVLDWKEAPSSS